MGRYAEETDVPAERSRAEIERVLQRYGAARFCSGWQENKGFVAFECRGRNVRFVLPVPDKNDKRFQRTPTGRARRDNGDAALRAWEQACRSRWRALLLVIKAKLEAVECGITTFEEEFLAHTLIVGNRTVAEILLPQMDTICRTGRMPKLLLPGLGRENGDAAIEVEAIAARER